VSGHEIRTNEELNYSLRYSLSEGDKNALSLSFFLAKLELIPDLSDYTILIDDPISSFDYSRKNTTINNLIILCKKVKCFILLTHDLAFANDFSKRLNYSCQNIKIIFNGTTSLFQKHDIESDTLTGIFKDLTVLNDYLEFGANTDSERRDVIRCIRPALEGIFRIKFFKKIKKNDWLGDIISKIRDSDGKSAFYRLQIYLSELSEVNDYSKDYHHSNPNYLEVPINDDELRNYVVRSLKLLEMI
jgi:wobble nucleotide-excising tRNase